MKLIITRHGVTEHNKNKIFQGHLPTPLSEEGLVQAKKLAKRLKEEKIDAIYSSDLKRAEQTAKEIAKYHKNAKLVFTKELREFDAGELTGKPTSMIDWNNLPKSMETFEQSFKRGENFLEKVFKQHKNQTVLFVGHGGINRAIISNVLGKGCDYLAQIQSHRNASVSIFELKEDKKHIIHLINCTKHLD